MSQDKFKVGEIAIVCRARFCPENLGQEVEMIEPYGFKRSIQTPSGFMGYVFRRQDGKEFVCVPEDLRKRRPPQDWVKLCNLTNVGETGPAESPGCSTQELRSDVEVAARTGRVLSTTVEHCAGGRSALAARDWRFHV